MAAIIFISICVLQVLMLISILVVMVSILSFVCETHYWFQVLKNSTEPGQTLVTAPDPDLYYKPTQSQCFCACGGAAEPTPELPMEYPETIPHPILDYIDYACLAFFSLELLLRFTFAPSKCDYLKGPLNLIDIICIIPQCISIALTQLGVAGSYGDVIKVITILRTVRVLRIFKLMKHYSAFKVLAYTIKVNLSSCLATRRCASVNRK